MSQKLPDWERLLSAQEIFQSHFPECILVEGTEAALHARHRVSLDAGHVLSSLKSRFAEILRDVEKESGWCTGHIEPPALTLENFRGVRTGIRKLIRIAPLKTRRVRGLTIPTPEEILRTKAYLIIRRNATRDYFDFVALCDHLGTVRALKALQTLDQLYPQDNEASVIQQLALQLADPKPWDFSQTDLSQYKSLRAPYTDWNEVKRRAFAVGQRVMNQLLNKSHLGTPLSKLSGAKK